MPPGRPYASARELIQARIAPAVRESGWLCGPGTTHYVSDQGSEAWLTVVTLVDDATDVLGDLAERLMWPATVETTDDVLLARGAERYRASLQDVTHVGLDVLEAGAVIPLSEYEAFEDPSEAAPLLMPFLNEASPAYRRGCSNYEATERFWLAFFGRGPAPELASPGHWLWNLGG
jgi:hypothetical protein